MKQGMKYTKRIDSITLVRNRQVNDYIKKSARVIIDYCLENKIGNMVVKLHFLTMTRYLSGIQQMERNILLAVNV
jgi:hypothetical protein